MAQEIIRVLDQGFVEYFNHMGNDLTVVNAAKVSKGKEVHDFDLVDHPRLLNYLMANGHTTPFEHCVISFRIRAPIFVFREWHRHRTWSYNELSARYAPVDLGHYVPVKVRAQSKTNKQGGDGFVQDWDDVLFREQLEESNKQADKKYKDALEVGIERGQARLFMQVNAFSEMIATVNLWNLFRFLELRMDKNAQWEIRQYAWACYDIAEPYFPAAFDAWRRRVDKFPHLSLTRE